MQDQLRTSQTYKTRKNAVKKLADELAKLNDPKLENVRYVIATNEEGRFAPVVIMSTGYEKMMLMHLAYHGITVVG